MEDSAFQCPYNLESAPKQNIITRTEHFNFLRFSTPIFFSIEVEREFSNLTEESKSPNRGKTGR